MGLKNWNNDGCGLDFEEIRGINFMNVMIFCFDY